MNVTRKSYVELLFNLEQIINDFVCHKCELWISNDDKPCLGWMGRWNANRGDTQTFITEGEKGCRISGVLF